MSFITISITSVMVSFACLMAVTLAAPDPEPDLKTFFDSFSSHLNEQGDRNARGVGDFFGGVGKTINKEVADIKQPIETAVVGAASSQCTNVKKIVGVAYDQVKDNDKEPNLNDLTLNFITNAYSITFNITQAARTIPESKNFNPKQKLYIFIHGFTDDPSKASFKNVSTALFSQGNCNVLALDGSSLIKWLYLRSTTYVRFMGEKLGEVLASMVQSGVDPAQIHVIGHSLGAHISGFTGKSFTNLTGLHLGRISGLDPAGPCFSHVDDDLRLKNTDAEYVDVIHTDGGVYGLTDSVGDVDYFPNDGEQQPQCLFQTCSHSRAWLYFTESVINSDAFPAVRCESWKHFKNGSCEDNISYMGLPSVPGTTGKYYLQTAGETPYGLGSNGTIYKNDQGIIKNITQWLSPSSAFANMGPDMSLRGLYTILFVCYTLYTVIL